MGEMGFARDELQTEQRTESREQRAEIRNLAVAEPAEDFRKGGALAVHEDSNAVEA